MTHPIIDGFWLELTGFIEAGTHTGHSETIGDNF